MIYLITYELFSPGKNYNLLFEAIQSIAPLAVLHSMNHTWFVRTTLTATQIRDILWQHVDFNDKIFVCEALNYASSNMGAGDWLNSSI